MKLGLCIVVANSQMLSAMLIASHSFSHDIPISEHRYSSIGSIVFSVVVVVVVLHIKTLADRKQRLLIYQVLIHVYIPQTRLNQWYSLTCRFPCRELCYLFYANAFPSASLNSWGDLGVTKYLGSMWVVGILCM